MFEKTLTVLYKISTAPKWFQIASVFFEYLNIAKNCRQKINLNYSKLCTTKINKFNKIKPKPASKTEKSCQICRFRNAVKILKVFPQRNTTPGGFAQNTHRTATIYQKDIVDWIVKKSYGGIDSSNGTEEEEREVDTNIIVPKKQVVPVFNLKCFDEICQHIHHQNMIHRHFRNNREVDKNPLQIITLDQTEQVNLDRQLVYVAVCKNMTSPITQKFRFSFTFYKCYDYKTNVDFRQNIEYHSENQDLLLVIKKHQTFKNEHKILYQKIMKTMLIDVWEEMYGQNFKEEKLAHENIKICEELSEKIVERLEHVFSFVRLIASRDDTNKYRCAPEGKIAIPEITLFSYAVCQMGLKDGETAYLTCQNVSWKLKNYKMYQLVLANLYVVVGMADDLSHTENYVKALFELLKRKICCMVEYLGMLKDCDELLNCTKRYYEIYTIDL